MTSLISALPPVSTSQNAGSSRLYPLDVSGLAVPAWQASVAIAANALLRPTAPNQTGFVYQATAAGQTGAGEPAWPRTAGGTVADGSITWTALTPPAGSEDSIASATWNQVNPPDGTLTITNQSNTSLIASARIGGGTSGQTYQVLVTITMTSGQVYPQVIYVTVI